MIIVRTGDGGYLNLDKLIRAHLIESQRLGCKPTLRLILEIGQAVDLAEPEATVVLALLEDLALPRPAGPPQTASGRPLEAQNVGMDLAGLGATE